MNEDKRIKSHNEKGQAHGYWERYEGGYGRLIYRRFYRNGFNRIGYEEFHFLRGKVRKVYYIR